jgi:hypothetical protein
MSRRHANESTQTRSHIVDSVEKRKSSFENARLSKKSVKISSKNDVHHRLAENVKAVISAVRRMIADVLYIIA